MMPETKSKKPAPKKTGSERMNERIVRLEESEKELKAHNKILRTEITALRKEKDILEEDYARIRSLLEHLQESKEQERSLVVHRIYDELGSLLAALKMDINLMSNELSEKISDVMKFRDASNRHIDTAIHDLRRLSDELRPPILDHLGLAAAIKWQADLFKKQTGLSCRVKIAPEDAVVERKVSIGLFRILRGLLENVVLHARAKSVHIGLKKDDRCYVLTVRDDGLGIDKEKLTDSQSWGLISMRERAQSLNGEMTIGRSRKGGTRVMVRVPREKDEGFD
jgi:signal transduction histidine kinase